MTADQERQSRTDARPDARSDARSLAEALRAAVHVLARAGVPSPRADVDLLAAHLLGVGPGALQAASLRGDPAPEGLDALVAARAAGAPVQHLTGRAPFRRVDLVVGPGVFIPRPETELVAGAAIAECVALASARADVALADESRALSGHGPDRLTVVDLCAGSGTIAAALADELPPSVAIVAVEIDPVAAGFARRNLPPTVQLVIADATKAATLPDLDGQVDVVVSNPPYVPDHAVVADDATRDPQMAVFGGATGFEVPLAVARRARGLLRPGGLLVMEHHDEGQPGFVEALSAAGFADVIGHSDLAGRPRYVTARRGEPASASGLAD